MNRAMNMLRQQLRVAGTGGGGGGGGGRGFQPGAGPTRALSALLLLGGGGAFFFNYCLYNVEGGHRAIIYNRVGGLQDLVIPEGTHFIVPWFQRPVIYDIRSRPRNIASLTGSRDLQMVNITLRVIYKPDEGKLTKLYRELGLDFDERVLPSIVNEVLKSVVAQYNASQLITQREQVSHLIRRNLEDRALDFGIQLDDVSITHLTFGREYTQAIEAKQVAQQEAERAKFTVDRALEEKKSIIIRAEGEAEAAALIASAVQNNPGFITLRRIEAAREVATTISRSGNKVFLNSDNLLANTLGDSAALQRDMGENKSKGRWFSFW